MSGDALAVINEINANGSHGFTNTNFGPPYLDVDADNVVSPNDALQIINYINAFGASEGEGEAVPQDSFFADLGSFAAGPSSTTTAAAAPAHDNMADLIALLASDAVLEQAKRRRMGQ